MLYIMRHGETDWNLENKIQGQVDVPLNDTGRIQVVTAAQKIAQLRIHRIVSSDLLRAAETAKILEWPLWLTVEYDARLREWDFGDLNTAKLTSVATFASVLTEYQKYNAESIDSVFTRVATFFDKFDMNQNTLIVSHGGLMRVMMYYLETGGKNNIDDFIKFGFSTHIGNAQVFAFKNKKFELVR
ncbi:MAG: histidine phosphatase family protein [Alphaproteobacteria bacterium]|nr:histidine phosphatase family protein [Alphaproteobacteria bacterium]